MYQTDITYLENELHINYTDWYFKILILIIFIALFIQFNYLSLFVLILFLYKRKWKFVLNSKYYITQHQVYFNIFSSKYRFNSIIIKKESRNTAPPMYGGAPEIVYEIKINNQTVIENTDENHIKLFANKISALTGIQITTQDKT